MLRVALFFLAVHLLLGGGIMGAGAEVLMPGWFGDNMVLQTNGEYGARSFLSGKAAPGEIVTVAISPSSSHFGNAYETAAEADGSWKVQLYPSSSSSAHKITVKGSAGGAARVARNVHFGDVFFCSGQSNMVFPLELAYNASEEAATLAGKPFSFFMVPTMYADEPQWTLNETASNETTCTANSPSNCNRWLGAQEAAQVKNGKTFISTFSAVCFMTVRDIAKMHTSKRYIGLVQSAYGGTRVESFMSAESIQATKYASKVPKSGSHNTASTGMFSFFFFVSIALFLIPNVFLFFFSTYYVTVYNAMIAPFNPFAVRAVLWYQGEANADQNIDGVDQTDYYATMFQAMIADWREKKFMGDFAWISMQLPPSVAAGTSPSSQMKTGRMQIRLAQAESLPRSGGETDIAGVAVGIDLGGKSGWGYDHPPNKNEMSRRLALQTLHAAYALQSPLWTGPVLETVSRNASGGITLRFASSTSGGMYLADVKSKNPDGTRDDCTLCCKNAAPFEVTVDAGKTWTRVAENQTIIGASAIYLAPSSHFKSASAVGVRYAMLDFVECVLYNSDDLPLGPFVRMLETEKSVSNEAEHFPTSDMPLSPPMGFNSWNFYHCNIDENTVKAVIDAMVENGMQRAGYSYVNIDDCWQVVRYPNGTIQPDPVRFPSGMKALSDYAHSKGMKFGVYTAQGSRTCQNRPGAYNHELIDAETYCSWGLDYLKNDNCGGTMHKQLNESWARFTQGFEKCYNASGRYIVRSVEYCKTVEGCGQWIAESANLWRTTSDVQASWESVRNNILANNKMAAVAKPGHFNDPDMLQVGNVGLSVIEQYSHMSLWSIAGAPLLAGTDLIHADKTTLDILSNTEVTSVNQDLGKDDAVQGVLVKSDANTEVWRKVLSDGTVAAVLLNIGDASTSVTAEWSDLGLKKGRKVRVRDLWKKKDLGFAEGDSWTAKDVPSHGCRFVTFKP